MIMIRWAALPAAATVLLTAAACGSGGSGASSNPTRPAPATLIKETQTAARQASSVHVAGTVTESGRALGLNLSMTRSGELSGQLSVDGAGFSVLSTGGNSYIKVTSAFLRFQHYSNAVCKLFCDKYLKVSTAQSRSLVGGLSMTRVLGDTQKSSSQVHNAGTATVNGQGTWVLRSSDGSTAYVASHGKPYLLRLVAPPAKSGRLDFTQWNSATIPSPPPSNQVVDLGQLHN
jgi:hypothetical protein